MNENQTIQALRLTIQELTADLVEVKATKHLLSLQLAEANLALKQLQDEKKKEEKDDTSSA